MTRGEPDTMPNLLKNLTAMLSVAVIMFCESASAQSSEMMGPAGLSEKIQIGANETQIQRAFPSSDPKIYRTEKTTSYFIGEWQVGVCNGAVFHVSRTISRQPEAFMTTIKALNGFLGEAKASLPKVYSTNGDAVTLKMSWASKPNYDLSLSYVEGEWIVSESNSVVCRD